MESMKEMKFGTKVAQGMRMKLELGIHAQHRESTWYHTRRWEVIAT